MEKDKFYLPTEPDNFEETLKGLYQLNYDDTGIEFNEKLDDKNRVIGIDYKDTLSSREALKNMHTSEIRMRHGSATITYNDDGTTFIDKKVTGSQARKTLGVKHFSPGFTFNYHWKRGFDENGRRVYASGMIEGEDRYLRDKDGRITLAILDNGRETNAFEYDEKGRIENWKHTFLRSGLDGKDKEEKHHFEYGENGSYTVKSINKSDNKIVSRSIVECNSQNEILSEIYQNTDLRTYYERHSRPQEDDYMCLLYDTESGKVKDVEVKDDKGCYELKGEFKFDAAAYLAVPNAVFRSCSSAEMLDKAVEYEQNLENSVVGNISKVREKINKTKQDSSQLAQSVAPKKASSRKGGRSAAKGASIEL